MAKGRAKHTRGKRGAAELKRRLTDAEFRDRVRFTADELKIIDRICTGKYVRNAAAIQRMFQLRADFAYPKPKQQLDVTTRTIDSGEISDEEWELLSELQHRKRSDAS